MKKKLEAIILSGLSLALVFVVLPHFIPPAEIEGPRDPTHYNLSVIANAASMYLDAYHSFPPSLASLGSPPKGTSSGAQAAGLIDEKLASGIKDEYRYTYRAIRSGSDGRVVGFTINADPVEERSEYQLHYFMGSDGVVRIAANSAATTRSPRID